MFDENSVGPKQELPNMVSAQIYYQGIIKQKWVQRLPNQTQHQKLTAPTA